MAGLAKSLGGRYALPRDAAMTTYYVYFAREPVYKSQQETS